MLIFIKPINNLLHAYQGENMISKEEKLNRTYEYLNYWKIFMD